MIRIYTVCHSFYIFWRHYFNVKLNCFILRTTTVAGLGVPIFTVITVFSTSKCSAENSRETNELYNISTLFKCFIKIIGCSTFYCEGGIIKIFQN